MSTSSSSSWSNDETFRECFECFDRERLCFLWLLDLRDIFCESPRACTLTRGVLSVVLFDMRCVAEWSTGDGECDGNTSDE